MSILDKGLIPAHSISAMVDAYEESVKDVKAAFVLLSNAKQRLKTHFGEHRDTVFDSRICDFNLEHESETAIKIIKKNVWKSLVDKCHLFEVVSEKRYNGIIEEIEKGETPEITVKIVVDWIAQVRNDIPTLINESMKEVFAFLRPNYKWGKNYKTNLKFKVGKKVILERIMDISPYYQSLSYSRSSIIKSMDNLFHLMDGKGFSKYPNDLLTIINQAINEHNQNAETDYFDCCWYKNGNLHIKFKRLDLVDKLNKMAGDSNMIGNEK